MTTFKNHFKYDPVKGLLIRLSSGKECITKAKGNAYVKIYCEGKYYQYHNVVYILHYGNIPEGYTVDHKDHDKLNNHHSNLRLATKAQQTYNTRSYGKTSKHKGVDYNKKSGKYFARIYFKGKPKFLGAFDNEELAAEAYKLESDKLHGEFNVNSI